MSTSRVTALTAALSVGWNVLDASVVALALVDAAMTGPSYSAVRAIRVLRPLRTITHIKGLRVSSNSIGCLAVCSSCYAHQHVIVLRILQAAVQVG